MYSYQRVLAVAVLVAMPAAAFADTAADLAAQAQALLDQVNALQAQLGGGGPSTKVNTSTTTTYATGCPNIGRVLKLGSSGSDVARLQQFLAGDPSVYPEGVVSGYFGSLTRAAVRGWQAKYNVVSGGTPESTGYGVVGPRTAAAIALLCAKGGNGVVASPVGGYVQVTPPSGNAPLSVTVTATVNSALSCSGAMYTLDYGDGTGIVQIPAPSGQCSALTQSFTHVYQTPGSYQIRLASGIHQTTAPIVVYGQGGVGPVNPVAPVGTMYSFTASGAAPLSTTLYVSCVNAPSYNIIFGDGSDLGSLNTGGTNPACNGGLQAVKHVYTSYGTFNAQLVLFVPQTSGIITPVTSQTVAVTVSNPTAGYTYVAPQITPLVGGNPLSAMLRFDLPSDCTGYSVSWGDGSPDSVQSDAGAACAPTQSSKSVSHQYPAPGTYTVSVKRGPTLTRIDSVGIVIQQ